MISHRWDISPKEAVGLQKELAGKVEVCALRGEPRTVAGADCAFVDRREVLAAAVLCDARTMETLAVSSARAACTFPYVPGLLSFREAPAVIQAVEGLSRRPDLLLCDGHGLAHPRRFGLACHVGLWLDLPTVGIAKSLLVGTHRMPGRKRRCRTQLRSDGEVIGAVVRTRTAVKPVIVSIGHRVTLTDAVAWTLRSARRVRLPEPSRRAHQAVSRLKAGR